MVSSFAEGWDFYFAKITSNVKNPLTCTRLYREDGLAGAAHRQTGYWNPDRQKQSSDKQKRKELVIKVFGKFCRKRKRDFERLCRKEERKGEEKNEGFRGIEGKRAAGTAHG